MDIFSLSFLIPGLPLLAAAVNGVLAYFGKNSPRRFIHTIACGSIFISFVLSVIVFLQLKSLPHESRQVIVTFFEWISLDSLNVNIAFLLDPLSAVMMLVVTGVGFLIHLYSIGYMRQDPSYARFFAYFNLFCFAMLLLVMADNLLLMFVGWEGVGLCSYLLIGFWYGHKPNAVAGMKAFIVNRIGDFGFLVGIMILFWATFKIGHPTFSFAELNENAHLLSGQLVGSFSLVTVVCIALFFGACGKSAQIPLYVWLPDAMAGPTPVSALIHAATMVTAGVYMIGRMNFLYAMSPTALLIVATVGAFTALYAATIGFAQNDIKKVLAYSTVSQLGYMFLGMGTGMYTAGIFHLVTHAFFKACLFLGAGSVILGMHHEQDMTRMGGLRKYMPITYATFLAATFALAGIFPLSGFFSKDEILWSSFVKAGQAHWFYVLWGLGLAGAFCTAFYMMRLVSLTFYGSLRKSNDHHQPLVPYESPRVITFVLVMLALLSIVGGFLGVPHSIGKYIGLPNYFEMWLSPVFGHHAAVESYGAQEYVLMAVSVSVALVGICIAVWLYVRRFDLVSKITRRISFIYKLVLNKYFVDEIYDFIFVRGLLRLNNLMDIFDNAVIDWLVNMSARLNVLWARLSGWFDTLFVDGAVNFVADVTIAAGARLKKIQTGRIQHYFYIALAGLLIIFMFAVK